MKSKKLMIISIDVANIYIKFNIHLQKKKLKTLQFFSGYRRNISQHNEGHI